MTATEIIDAVLRGECDDNLAGVTGAVKDRKAALARVTFRTVKPGQRVRLGNISPQYLDGATATIKERKQTRISVVIDPEFVEGTRYTGSVTVRPEMIVEILPDVEASTT